MEKKEKIPLFWWSEPRLMGKTKENYGDLLSRYLVEKISGKEAEWIQPKKIPWYKKSKTNYLATGSIIHHANEKSIVWGSGIIDRQQKIQKADFRAVRGPETRKYLLKTGYECPEIYGDPALLMPQFYNPQVEKKYKIGLIPHYHDLAWVQQHYKNDNEIAIIDMMTLDVEMVTKKILECERTISSSLHGIIISHAYNIPSIQVEFSDKIFGDGIKYKDYFLSVNIPIHSISRLKKKQTINDLERLIQNQPNLPNEIRVIQVQTELWESCPFRKD